MAERAGSCGLGMTALRWRVRAAVGERQVLEELCVADKALCPAVDPIATVPEPPPSLKTSALPSLLRCRRYRPRRRCCRRGWPPDASYRKSTASPCAADTTSARPGFHGAWAYSARRRKPAASVPKAQPKGYLTSPYNPGCQPTLRPKACQSRPRRRVRGKHGVRRLTSMRRLYTKNGSLSV